MRHNRDIKKFGRTASHRNAMFRNMATSLLREGRIKTTLAKAKEVRRVTDRLVTLAKHAAAFSDADEQKVTARRLHLRRQALGFVRDKDVVAKLFDEIADKYVDRNGGYTRVIKLGQRRGDGAEVAIVELVEEEIAEKPKKKRGKKSAKKAAPAKKAPKAAKAKEETTKEAPAETAPEDVAAETPAEEPPAEESAEEAAAPKEAPAEEEPPADEPVEETPTEEETPAEEPDEASGDDEQKKSE